MNGIGTLIYANGNKYEGEFKHGREDGTGTLTLANGTKNQGQFSNGEFQG